MRYKQGSLTVEATLVMILTLSVMAFIISSGLFMYDRCVMLGSCYRGAVYGADYLAVKKRADTGKFEEAAESSGKAFFLRNSGFEGTYGWGRISITGYGSRKLNSIALSGLMLKGEQYSTNVTMSCYCPCKERIIRATRGISKLKDSILQKKSSQR